jgi:hypothetical protein
MELLASEIYLVDNLFVCIMKLELLLPMEQLLRMPE